MKGCSQCRAAPQYLGSWMVVGVGYIESYFLKVLRSSRERKHSLRMTVFQDQALNRNIIIEERAQGFTGRQPLWLGDSRIRGV